MARSNKKKGGWYKHPDEHALASRGIKTTMKSRGLKPEEVYRKFYPTDMFGYEIKDDRLGEFFVVINPETLDGGVEGLQESIHRDKYDMEDILDVLTMNCDVASMMLQSRGGLLVNQVYGIYTDPDDALEVVEMMIEKYNLKER